MKRVVAMANKDMVLHTGRGSIVQEVSEQGQAPFAMTWASLKKGSK